MGRRRSHVRKSLGELKQSFPQRHLWISGRHLVARPVFGTLERDLAHWDLDIDGQRSAVEFASPEAALDWGIWMAVHGNDGTGCRGKF